MWSKNIQEADGEWSITSFDADVEEDPDDLFKPGDVEHMFGTREDEGLSEDKAEMQIEPLEVSNGLEIDELSPQINNFMEDQIETKWNKRYEKHMAWHHPQK